MRIKNVKKFVRSILIVLGIILALSLVIAKVSYSHGEKQYKSIYVSEGDTLWNIAKENQITNQYYKDKDVRYIINDLMKINNLSNSNIRINQEILIPII
ncbi:MAG: LysM peptidoglycan-binding domain-containing protein [Clostridia bacterium]|nr:LysM peptidoglycan-binding domain-containing protein [Clostridia bacterium]